MVILVVKFIIVFHAAEMPNQNRIVSNEKAKKKMSRWLE